MASKRKKTTACNEGREFPDAKRQATLDRTRTSEDLFVCEMRLRKCQHMLYATYLEALQVAMASEGIRDADRGFVPDDAPLDNFARILIPLVTIGRALAQWTEDVDELIDNEFELAKSPFAIKDTTRSMPKSP